MAQFTRRDFGKTVLASAAAATAGKLFAQDCAPPVGTPVDFVVPNLPTIQRKSIAELTPDEVTRLRLAYQKLRDLANSDPSGYSSILDVSALASRLFVLPRAHSVYAAKRRHISTAVLELG